MSVVRIATRASDLALTQTRTVAARLAAALSVTVELVPLKTTGDRLKDVSLAKVGGKGLFVKEIEEALLDGRADLAVHSAKDLPAELAPGLELVAYPEREDPRDALIAKVSGTRLADLRRGAVVGTGSVRRAAQLLAVRPDLEIAPLRGNVPTRLRKLEGEEFDAIVLACAGLERLGLADRIDERIALETLLPAVGQGALALEGRVGDAIARDARALDDPHTAASLSAERAFLRALSGDCTVPLAAHATHEPDPSGAQAGRLHLRALLASADGTEIVRAERIGPLDRAAASGASAAEEILAAGGREILAALANEPGS